MSASVLRSLDVDDSRFCDVGHSGVVGEGGHFGGSTYEAVKLIRAVAAMADGLAAVRATEWAHLDVKPSNILHDHSYQPKLIDLGAVQPRRERSLEWLAAPGSTARFSHDSMRPVEMVQRVLLDVPPDHRDLGGSYDLLTGEAAEAQRWEVGCSTVGLGDPRARNDRTRSSRSSGNSCEDCAFLMADGAFVVAQIKGHRHASYPRSWLSTVLSSAPMTIVVLVYRAEAKRLISGWSTLASPGGYRSAVASRTRQPVAVVGARSTVFRQACAVPAYARTGGGIDREEGEVAGMQDKVDKAYEAKSINEIADAPVEALQGVSEGDAKHLKAAFNIKTVRDLGTNKYFLWAQAIAKIAE